MFLRRLMRSDSSARTEGPPPGMQTMDIALQNRFAKGVNYNMKIVIKGDRNVGKSCLLSRLQGQKFKDEYIPTDEIQVGSINWNYKTSDDVIKVEIWDVVDKGRKKRKIDGLKLDTNQGCDDLCLDGDLVNVYKGAHGVIILFDITKQWTFEYVEREVIKIPSSLPLLLLGNHRDMGHHRTITELQAKSLVDQLQITREMPVRYTTCSMRNGFGLKFIHKFFNIPFLHLQKSCLVHQLESNGEEMLTTLDELDMLQESKDLSYDSFIDGLLNKKRDDTEKILSNNDKPAPNNNDKQASSNNNKPGHNNDKLGYNNDKPDPINNMHSVTAVNCLDGLAHANESSLNKTSIICADNNLKLTNNNSNISGNSSSVKPSTPSPVKLLHDPITVSNSLSSNVNAKLSPIAMATSINLSSVDDFQPEDETLDLQFLELDTKMSSDVAATNAYISDSSEDEKLNPLVQIVKDEDDDDEDVIALPDSKQRPASDKSSSNADNLSRNMDKLSNNMDKLSNNMDNAYDRLTRDSDSFNFNQSGSEISDSSAMLFSVSDLQQLESRYNNQGSTTTDKPKKNKKEKSTDCDSAWIPLLCVHG